MKVYILSVGERCEGSRVVGVYSDLELALVWALEQPTHFEAWREDDNLTNYWTSGCDYMVIKEYDIVHPIKIGDIRVDEPVVLKPVQQ